MCLCICREGRGTTWSWSIGCVRQTRCNTIPTGSASPIPSRLSSETARVPKQLLHGSSAPPFNLGGLVGLNVLRVFTFPANRRARCCLNSGPDTGLPRCDSTLTSHHITSQNSARLRRPARRQDLLDLERAESGTTAVLTRLDGCLSWAMPRLLTFLVLLHGGRHLPEPEVARGRERRPYLLLSRSSPRHPFTA